jgi:hypothetical protein
MRTDPLAPDKGEPVPGARARDGNAFRTIAEEEVTNGTGS